MNILELFAGTRSIGKIAQGRGHQVFSVDWKYFEDIDLVADIEFLTPAQIPFCPDMVWASPDCSTYSIAAGAYHRIKGIPQTEKAEKSDRVVKRVLDLIDHWTKENKYLIFDIENPTGQLRKMPFMRGIPKARITYCSYGHEFMKPTDIWSNNIYSVFNPLGWEPKPVCRLRNTSCHHWGKTIKNTGTPITQSIIPPPLCMDIIKANERKYEAIRENS